MGLLSGGLLVLAIAMLAATGMAAAFTLLIGSLAESLLAAYVIAWAWLVASLTALSLVGGVSAPGLWVVLIAGVACSGTAWYVAGRPRLALKPSVVGLGEAIRVGPVAVLAVSVALGVAYTLVAGIGVAPNDGDALAYHLPRALLWKQQESVGWIPDATDSRLNVMPPVAEMGQLATMLVSDRDRFVAVGQLAALFATAGAIALLARRLGSDTRGAVFGALLFVSLPVVILQAASALNDLVVCSFLACTAALLLSNSRAAVAVGALSTALAVGTKVTAVFGLPWIALVVLTSMRQGRLRSIAALVGGALLGSGWYWMNLWHTGHLDGGYGSESGQRPDGMGVVATTLRQLGLDLLDRSGVNGRDVSVYGIAALVLAAAAILLRARGKPWLALLLGAVLVAVVPVVLAPVGSLLLQGWQEAWTALGDAELAVQPPTEFELSVLADATESWYGPVLVVCLVLTPVALLWRSRHRSHRRLLTALSAAPIVSLVALAALLTYDPFRGRFLMFAVALAAAGWGSLLRWPAVAWGLTGLAMVTAGMSIAMSMGKPSGLVLFEDDPGPVSRDSIWGRTRAAQQGQLRPGGDEIDVVGFVETAVPESASIALALRPNDYLSPFFGAGLGRQVVLIQRERSEGLAGAAWLVTAPRTGAGECPDDWREEFGVGDWKVLRRVANGSCQVR
ncbi:MAG TPA: hypothetical protein VFO26_13655 [Gaiella sp.]|uniref:hypothetical protein n=1 Tax=Gaiella sp. TaxID=2663207 RepID=UPI002D80B862|nr:hypothetical protein [Gaiella sp.]HET9288596.1 hypothetical protein [Gaiella sp.]